MSATPMADVRTTAVPVLAALADPATGTRRTLTAGETLSQTMSMAWRALKKMRRNPEQFFDVTLQPVLFTAMFAYIFGGAVSGDVQSYLPLIIPGVLAMSTLTASMATGVQLREDMDLGVFERFTSLPISRLAPLLGPVTADVVRYAIAASITFATGFLMGYRPAGGVVGVAGALLLCLATGWSVSWVFTWVGTVARSAQGVQGISMMFLFPLTFLSNAFVPVDTLPGWLKVFVTINPVSHVVTAIRDLANFGAVTMEVTWSLLGCAVLVGVFAPLAVRQYRRRM